MFVSISKQGYTDLVSFRSPEVVGQDFLIEHGVLP